MSKQRLTGKQALRTIKNIHLYGMKTDVDENYDGELEYTDYEEDYGSINHCYSREIKAIYKDLDRYNELMQVVKIISNKMSINLSAQLLLTLGQLSQREYKLLKKYFKDIR